MADLHSTVVAELDRLERLYGGDRKDGRHAALKAAVEWHEPRDSVGRLVCATCESREVSLPFPCDELLEVAKALGIEASDGG